MSGTYYNEIDPYAAEWLRNLIKEGLIPVGDVDERDIRDVTPKELMGYTQCHFFAGIGGWAYALRLAGWPDDRPVWIGSCPCQSFSAAGRGKGFADERHLWPHWFHLIRECKPPILFGEQVASKLALSWLDLVFDDLEAEGYACGAADLCAAGVGAPHIRQRLWWVGHAETSGCEGNILHQIHGGRERERAKSCASRPSPACELADALGPRLCGGDQRGLREAGREVGKHENGAGAANESGDGCEDAGTMADALRGGAKHRPGEGLGEETTLDGKDRNLQGQRLRSGVEGASNSTLEKSQSDRLQREKWAELQSIQEREHKSIGGSGFWSSCTWLPCRDGKWRATQPGIQPLAHGVPARVGKLRAAGNAIVPQVAAEFVRIFL